MGKQIVITLDVETNTLNVDKNHDMSEPEYLGILQTLLLNANAQAVFPYIEQMVQRELDARAATEQHPLADDEPMNLYEAIRAAGEDTE